MNQILITFRSVTFAQRGERLLQKQGIPVTLRRTPRVLAGRGCGYCLYLRSREGLAAVELLRGQGIPFGKVYTLEENGKPEELAQ